jgi:hypothetical protein
MEPARLLTKMNNPKGVRCFFELTAAEKDKQKPMMKMVNVNS